MRIGDEIYVHGYVEEIRQDKVIIRNDGGYFRTVLSEMREATQEECEGVDEYISRISEDVPDIGVGKNYNPKGRTESSMTILRDVLKEAYCSGYADGLNDRIESDYDRGYKAALADKDLIPCQQDDRTSDQAYKNGLDRAWAVASDITHNRGNVRDIIGKKNAEEIFDSYTAQEVLNILDRHEHDEKILPDDWMDIEADMLTHDQAREAVRVLRREIMKLKEENDKNDK